MLRLHIIHLICIYRMMLSEGKFKLHKVLKGNYTYPRFVYTRNNFLYLFVRNVSSFSYFSFGKNGGLLESENIVEGDADKYIYVTKPNVVKQNIYFSYNIYSQINKKRSGLFLLEFNENKVKTYDVGDLGLIYPWVMDVTIFDSERVKILVVDQIKGSFDEGGENVIYEVNFNFKTKEVDKIKLDEVKYFYYPSLAVYSSLGSIMYEMSNSLSGNNSCVIDGSFRPSFVLDSDSFIFLLNNKKYSIRNFDTSLYICIDGFYKNKTKQYLWKIKQQFTKLQS